MSTNNSYRTRSIIIHFSFNFWIMSAHSLLSDIPIFFFSQNLPASLSHVCPSSPPDLISPLIPITKGLSNKSLMCDKQRQYQRAESNGNNIIIIVSIMTGTLSSAASQSSFSFFFMIKKKNFAKGIQGVKNERRGSRFRGAETNWIEEWRWWSRSIMNHDSLAFLWSLFIQIH